LKEGENAIINITSCAKDVPYENPPKFWCVPGAAILVNVAVKGDLVVLRT